MKPTVGLCSACSGTNYCISDITTDKDLPQEEDEDALNYETVAPVPNLLMEKPDGAHNVELPIEQGDQKSDTMFVSEEIWDKDLKNNVVSDQEHEDVEDVKMVADEDWSWPDGKTYREHSTKVWSLFVRFIEPT